MAQADWQGLVDNASSAEIDHGVTAGSSKPYGGGVHCYAYKALVAAVHVSALHAGQVNYNPMAQGCSIRGAIRRAAGTGFSPFLFCGLQGTSKTNAGYMLGLSDANPYRIVLRKGILTDGLPDGGAVPDAAPNILMRSTKSYADNPWIHLRMDAIVQGTGDVLIQVFENDLVNPVSSPVWVEIPGMEGPQAPAIAGFVDDALGINTSSLPFTAGRAGFGLRSASTGARAFFDHIEVARQL